MSKLGVVVGKSGYYSKASGNERKLQKQTPLVEIKK